jgi:glycosyltransferase involved in cell wall biosynthesis
MFINHMKNSVKKLKIIYLINGLGKGGSERQLYLLLKYMDLTTAEPMVVVFNPSTLTDYADAIRDLGIKVIELPASIRSIPKRLYWLLRLFRQQEPDIVHSWSAPDNPYAGLAGMIARVPLRLGSFRDSLANRGFLALPPLLQLLTLRACPYIVVNSGSILDELLARNLSPKRVFLLENCVEIPSSTVEVDLPTALSGDVRLVGTVCNIRRKKNIHIFIEGLSRLVDLYPNLRGVIVGQPLPNELDYHDYIQELIFSKNLSDRVFLLGFRDDAPHLVQKFEVFCLLSEYEGSPNAILEAMAAGRPVIATNTSGIPDLVKDGVNGYLVPVGDADAFAHALEKLLSNPNIERMGVEGRKKVESKFTCQQKAAQLLNIYQQLLKRKL